MFKTNSNLRSVLFLGAATAAALSLSGPAAADQMETVVVTGSHLASPNLSSAAPVVEATATDIAVQGVTKIEDLLNQMPQVFAAQNATVSNGSTGTATLNLRGLGCGRTLVLVDGRRLPFGTPLQGGICPDVNEIPTQLIDRVEVLAGGASAVYGSDAIAGVVNFITKQDFEGIQFNAQYGTYQHSNGYNGVTNLRNVIATRGSSNPSQFKLPNDDVWDGVGKQLSVMMGTSSANGKGNVTAYFSYRQNDKISEANRDYSACSAAAQGTTTVNGKSVFGLTCGGSGTSATGQFNDFSNLPNVPYAVDPSCWSDATANATYRCSANYTVANTNQFRRFSNATDQYNYGPTNYYQRPDERYSFGATGHYDFSSHFKFYGQLMFTSYSTVAQIAPSGDFFNTSTVNCDNPLLSTQQVNLLCNGYYLRPDGTMAGPVASRVVTSGSAPVYIGRRNIEGGGRQDTLRYDSYRASFGVKGDIDSVWSYDLFASYARVDLNRVYLNDFSVTRLNRALDVVNVNGTPTCQSVVDGTDKNCVPYNVFSTGGVTRAALNYLQIPLVMNGASEQETVSFLVTGDLGKYDVKSPFADNGIQIALGTEYRQDALETIPDTSFQTGDGAGQGGAVLGYKGQTHVIEGFTEVNVPLIENQPLIQSANLKGAYRFSAYDYVTTNTFEGELDWAPTTDIRFRGNYQRAVRAPNVFELYQGQGTNLFDADYDPCSSVGRTAGAPAMNTAQCIGTNSWQVTSTQSSGGSLNSPAGQYNFLQGGNTALKAEKSDTLSFGVVLTPSFVPGLNVTLDYFNIKTYKLIGTAGATNIFTACYEANDLTQCARIHRGPGGTLWINGGYVEDLNTNIGGIKTSGVDFNVNYQADLADFGLENAGVIAANLQGTWLNALTTDTGVGTILKCAGYFGTGGDCGVPNPKWRHVFRLNWETPWHDLVVTGTWRFYGAVKQYGGSSKEIDYQFSPYSYFDLSLAAPVTDGATLRVGVNNLFDLDPPITHIAGTTGNGNTYPQTYDAFGRYLFASVTLNL